MTPEGTLLSIVVPVYNEEEMVERFYEALTKALEGRPERREILFVDDGSTDKTLKGLMALQAKDPTVVIASLSRNFGHQAALTAGIDLAAGDAVIMLDGDLQHPPELIGKFVERWREGYSVVQGVRDRTEDAGPAKRLGSALYYRVFNRLSPTPLSDGAADFRLLDRKAVDALKGLRERHRLLRAMIAWLGLPQAELRFTAGKRPAGRTKYSPYKMLALAVDGLLGFSSLPLRAALWLGLAALAATGAYGLYTLYVRLVLHETVRGWSSIVLLIMFLGSVQLIWLGILGEYVGRIYEELKERPLYVLRGVRRKA